MNKQGLRFDNVELIAIQDLLDSRIEEVENRMKNCDKQSIEFHDYYNYLQTIAGMNKRINDYFKWLF